MEQGVAVHVDANVDALHDALPKSKQNGERAVKVALGGIDDDSLDEDTPLLAGNGNASHGQGAGSNAPVLPSNEYDEWAGLPWYKQPSVYWFLVPFIFSAIAFGGIIVPKLSLITSLLCREYYTDKGFQGQHSSPSGVFTAAIQPQCDTPEVQASVARFALQGSLISGILSAFIAPKLGALSDRYGRKKMMMITNAGALSGEIITIFAATAPETFPVFWILVGYFLDGMCGSFTASMAISHSYATDCTPPRKRNVIFAYFHGMMFTGIAIGPLLAARIVKAGGVIAMFYIALGCHLAFIVLLLFFIPESLSKARQMAARERYRLESDSNPAGDWIAYIRNLNLLRPLDILVPKGTGSIRAVRRNLVLLASVDTICFGVGIGAMTASTLYMQYHFKLTDEQWSNYIGIISISRVVCLLIILPIVTRLVRGKPAAGAGHGTDTGMDLFELSVIRVAILFDIIGYLGYALAPTRQTFLIAGMLASVGGVGSPTLQAALTKHVPSDQIGQLLGAMALLHAFARIIAPAFFNTVYAATVGKFDQTIFVILTAMFSVVWIVSWMLKPNVHIESAEEERERNAQTIPPEVTADPLLVQ